MVMPGHDPHMFETHQQTNRPEKIEKLHRKDESSQRSSRRKPLGSKGYTDVSDEHGAKLARRVEARSENRDSRDSCRKRRVLPVFNRLRLHS